jgi:tRNA pseudouridine13 synthase
VFNAVLDARVQDGTWTTPLEGDLLKVRSSGGLFPCSDVQTDRERAATGEVSPTGPIVGSKMRWPEGAAGDLEHRMSEKVLGPGFDLERTRRLGEGSRRALRVWIADLGWAVDPVYPGSQLQHDCVYSPGELRSAGDMSHDDGGHAVASIRVHFVLPKGAYATTVLGAAFELGDAHEVEGPPEDS